MDTNLEQINTFQGGMNTDTADFILDPQLYRYAENLRFLTQGNNNTGELKTIEGYSKVLDLPEGEIVLKTDSIRNYGIIITGDLNRNNWKIYTLDDKSLKLKCVFGPCTTPIGDTISLVSRWETDKLVKLYIADGKQRLMSINLLHSDYTTDGEGNLIPPSDMKYIQSYSNVVLKKLSALLLYGGSLKPAVVQYTYRLYKDGGHSSELAPLSELIYLLSANGEGYSIEDTTDKAVKLTLTLDNIQSFNKILIYRITYNSDGITSTPNISVIYDDNFNGSLSYIDVGLDIYSISQYELEKLLTSDKFKPTIIESKQNYLFAANIIDYQDEIEDQWKDVKFTGENACVKIYPAYEDAPSLNTEDISQLKHYYIDKTGNIHCDADTNDEYVPSLMPGETYVYGIILYDLDGNKSSVKYIGEVTIPDTINTVYVETHGKDIWIENRRDADTNHLLNYYRISPVGVKIEIGDIPNCSAYEIVRCLRDVDLSRTLYQGIIGFAQHWPDKNTAFTPPCLTDTLFYRTIYSQNNNDTSTINDLMLFACPEYAYLPEQTKREMPSNIEVKPMYNYIPLQRCSEPYAVKVDDEIYGEYVDILLGESLSGTMNDVHGLKFALGSTRSGEYMFRNDPYNELFTYTYNGQTISDLCRYNFKFGDKDIYTSIGYIYPASVSYSDLPDRNIKYLVSSVGFVDSFHPEYKTYDENKNFVGCDEIGMTCTVGGYNYYNWNLSRMIDSSGYPNISDQNTVGSSPGGKYIVMKLETPYPTVNPQEYPTKSPNSENYFVKPYLYTNLFLLITVANIINNDYKGYPNKDLLKYYSFGNHRTYLKNHTEIIYDGDTYVNMFIFNASFASQLEYFNLWNSVAIYAVPLHSRINLRTAYGTLYPEVQHSHRYLVLDYKGTVYDYTQDKDAYLYNVAYGSVTGMLPYTPLTNNEVYSDKFDVRIKYAGPKDNGETFDSWLLFYSSDTMDVDSRFGQVTDMRLFKDYLVFWQESATGLISSNERNIIQDLDGSQLLLGTGDVLQRYDYLTTDYGMKLGDFSETQSNTTLYWWDSYKKEIISYPGGREVLPLKKVKNISNYINNTENTQHPHLLYDTKYNEVLFNVVGDKPIIYSELIQQFTSIYTIPLDSAIRFKEYSLIFGTNSIYKWNNRGETLIPKLQYVVNKFNTNVKVFDTCKIGISDEYQHPFTPAHYNNLYNGDIKLPNIEFSFYTKEQKTKHNVHITSREYDYRFDIPRAGKYYSLNYRKPWYGNRMRGKTMLGELREITGDSSFSIQYILTKFRISYS